MASAAMAGIPPHEFWDLTPRELRAAFKGDDKRHRRSVKVALMQAWKTVEMMPRHRKHKMPNLSQMLGRLDEEQRVMDAGQLRKSLIAWNNEIGGAVRVVPKGTIRRA